MPEEVNVVLDAEAPKNDAADKVEQPKDPVVPKDPIIPKLTPEQQAIYDAKVEERLARQKKQYEERLAKVRDYDDIRAKLEELETKGLSETEKIRKEHEKLVGTHKTLGEELVAYKLKDTIYSALLDAGCNPKSISKVALRIAGETPEEIAADVAEYKKENPAAFGNYSVAGGGHPAVTDAQNAPKVWRASEIRNLTHEQRIANEADIMRAMKTQGGIIMD
jgi:hypothetical protein